MWRFQAFASSRRTFSPTRGAIGRNRPCRRPWLARAVLRHRQWRSRHAEPLRETRGPCAVLVVAWRTRLSGDRAPARGTGGRIGPDAQGAVLTRLGFERDWSGDPIVFSNRKRPT